jgi:ferredoxin
MMQHIPLQTAYLCQDCNSIGNCATQCPACASTVLMSLSSVLDRAPVQADAALTYAFPNAVPAKPVTAIDSRLTAMVA